MTQVKPAENATLDTLAAEGTLETQKEHPHLRSMVHIFAMEASQRDGGSSEFVLDVMEGILAATTVDEIFAAQDAGTMSGKDFTNRPFFLKTEDVQIMRSTLETSLLPFYAMMKVTEIATGEELTVNCGGSTFMAVLHGLMQLNYFDVTEEFPLGRSVTLIATAAGNGEYLSLKPYKIAAPSRAKK